MGRQVEYCGKLTPVLRITDVLPYSILQGCYQVLERCKKPDFKGVYQLRRAHEPPYRTTPKNVDFRPITTARRRCAMSVECAR